MNLLLIQIKNKTCEGEINMNEEEMTQEEVEEFSTMVDDDIDLNEGEE
jgi:hypothetical protein